MAEQLKATKKFPNKRKSLLTKNAKKQKKISIPTAKELEELVEAETVFHSNLFKMEVDELIKEIKPEVSIEKIDEWINQLRCFLSSLSETTRVSNEEYCTSVKFPILKYIKTDKCTFRFLPPVNITKIGSYALGTTCHSEAVLDIAVEIPRGCWQTMDHLNNRYLIKRAFYLIHIAEQLQKSNLIENIHFQYESDCYMKPNLLITPKSIPIITCLVPYPSEESFKLSRFAPARNNVRSSWVFETTEDDLETPTPYYNSIILRDLLLPKLNSFILKHITSDNIKDGIKLIKIWCIQRELLSGYNRLNGFIVTMFVAYLLQKQKISPFMNAYQVFRCTLLALQHENFCDGILAQETENKQPIEDFKKVFSSIFLDESGYLNMLYSISKETIDMIKHEAKIGLQILDSYFPNSFTLLFMNKVPAMEKFEFLIHLNRPQKFRKYFNKLCGNKDTLNYGENKISPVMPKICDIFRQGLNKRILLLDVMKRSPSMWPVQECPPSPNSGHIIIGLILNHDVPMNNLEKGPLADDPQAIEFREFWGKKSEIRRFKDGTIREAVFWPAETIEEKRKVISQMISDIFKRHLDGKPKLRMNGTELECILHLPDRGLSEEFGKYGTGEEVHLILIDTFNSLSKQLRKLNELPLSISSIQGISPAFHFCDVFPPLPVSYSPDATTILDKSNSYLKVKKNTYAAPPFVPALRVIIGFEGSGKWPDDVEAIKRVKTAFLIKIAKLVTSKYSLVAVPFPTYTDIIKDGFIFRIEIVCHKELYLMKQTITPSGMTKIRETDETRALQLKTEILPKLNGVLHGLHQQHGTFGTACRIAKRWASSHFILDYMEETAIELLVAHCYCHPEPYTIPSTPQIAFLRFLSLLGNYEWEVNPLFVNLNNELQKNDYEEINSSFTAQRSTLPPMVIVTPFDKRGNLFTKSKPDSLILNILILLSKSCLKIFEEQIYSLQIFDAKVIFRPPLDLYDLVIQLNLDAIPKIKYDPDLKEVMSIPCLKPYMKEKIYPVVEYDPPLKYLEELRANFGKVALFFYDVYGGYCIRVVWKKMDLEKEIKDGNLESVDTILEDMKLIGRGLVQRIEIYNYNLNKYSE